MSRKIRPQITKAGFGIGRRRMKKGEMLEEVEHKQRTLFPPDTAERIENVLKSFSYQKVPLSSFLCETYLKRCIALVGSYQLSLMLVKMYLICRELVQRKKEEENALPPCTLPHPLR